MQKTARRRKFGFAALTHLRPGSRLVSAANRIFPASYKASRRRRNGANGTDEGRIIGAVWVEVFNCSGSGHTLDIGRAQLSVGMAWWFRRYAADPPDEARQQYKVEESEAKVRRVGLWQDKKPGTPWDWKNKYLRAIVPLYSACTSLNN